MVNKRLGSFNSLPIIPGGWLEAVSSVDRWLGHLSKENARQIRQALKPTTWCSISIKCLRASLSCTKLKQTAATALVLRCNLSKSKDICSTLPAWNGVLMLRNVCKYVEIKMHDSVEVNIYIYYTYENNIYIVHVWYYQALYMLGNCAAWPWYVPFQKE